MNRLIYRDALLGSVDLCLKFMLSDKVTVIKAKAMKFSELNDEVLTQSSVILASALGAMTIFNTNGISIRSFGITKLHSRCFVTIKK